jgi:phage tail sheath protein FI
MPEYLAPGVFVEEVSYRAKSIEGVSTTTTGFIGPTRYGPLSVEPELITGMADYERVYGDGGQLVFANAAKPQHNFMWHAARAFFENGGKRLYVQRVFEEAEGATHGGRAHWEGGNVTIESRFPGAASSRRVRVSLELGPNVLSALPELDLPGQIGSPPEGSPPEGSPPEHANQPGIAVLHSLADRDVVRITRRSAGGAAGFFLARSQETNAGRTWTFQGGTTIGLSDLEVYLTEPDISDQVQIVTATVTVYPEDPDTSLAQVWGRLPLDPDHVSFGAHDSLTYQFAEQPENLDWRRTVPIVVTMPETVDDGFQVFSLLAARARAQHAAFDTALADPLGDVNDRSFDVFLNGGDDGNRPGPAAYEGEQLNPDDKSGLKQFEDLEDISIVAAPGATFGMSDTAQRGRSLTIIQSLLSHAQRMRYRIAVLESGDGQDLGQVQALRAGLDSKHGALYYPWVRIFDPITKEEISLPPAGFVAGIFARNDTERAVFKAPANEVVTLAIGFERTLNKAQQEVLNPKGINCFRYFEGRGNRLWGARTISSDPEWKYVNMRRYFAYVERSIDVGTQWAVFEPNGPQLWSNVRRTVSDFLFNEFVNGAFVGATPETSYFVRCDRSTMTQNDLDNGRLVCLVGLAVVTPAEFVIFRIGQWTASAKS